MQPARATEQVGHMAVRAIDLPRVLVVSDVLLYRDGVAGGLAAAGMLVVVGAATGHEALVAMSCDAADAIVIDASTPDILGVARALRMTWPRVPVIGFGISGDATGIACAEAGLTGFVGREGTLADLAVVRLSDPQQGAYSRDLTFTGAEAGYLALQRAVDAGVQTVAVPKLDRPLVLTNVVDRADAVLANYGVSDAVLMQTIAGQRQPGGDLPFELPRSMAAVLAQLSDVPDDSADPLFPVGYGLEYASPTIASP